MRNEVLRLTKGNVMDYNEHSLAKHMDEVERQEKAQSSFDIDIKEDIAQMVDMISEMRLLAKDYDGYDLSEYCEECISETLAVRK